MKSMSKGILFLIGLIRRMGRRYRRFLLPLPIRKEKLVLSYKSLKKLKSSTALVIQE
jgi:hypothetical protein